MQSGKGSTASSHEQQDTQKTTDPAAKSSLNDYAADDKTAYQFTSSSSLKSSLVAPNLSSSDDVVSVKYTEAECGQSHSSNQHRVLDPISEVNPLSTENPTRKLSTLRLLMQKMN